MHVDTHTHPIPQHNISRMKSAPRTTIEPWNCTKERCNQENNTGAFCKCGSWRKSPRNKVKLVRVPVRVSAPLVAEPVQETEYESDSSEQSVLSQFSLSQFSALVEPVVQAEADEQVEEEVVVQADEQKEVVQYETQPQPIAAPVEVVKADPDTTTEGKKRNGDRGKDSIPRKKRSCIRCTKYGAIGAFMVPCDGQIPRRTCQFFNEDGTIKPSTRPC
jgi:hypothetical protein